MNGFFETVPKSPFASFKGNSNTMEQRAAVNAFANYLWAKTK